MLIIYASVRTPIEQYRYSSDDRTDVGSEIEGVTIMENYSYAESLDFDINSESGTEILKTEELRFTLMENLHTKSALYFDSVFLCVAELKITFTYDDETSEEIKYYATDMAFERKLYIHKTTGKIKGVTVEIIPLSVSKSCNYNFETNSDIPVEKTGVNTVKSNISGVMECYDRYMTIIDSIIVEKGGSYTVPSSIKSFSIIYRRE